MKWRIVFASAPPDPYGKVDPLAVLGVVDIHADDVAAVLRQVQNYRTEAMSGAHYVGIYAA